MRDGITIFTIGFAKKSAKGFFERLKESGVRKVVDVRLSNSSQLAGFTKKGDLEFLLKEIGGIEYVHLPDLAPTEEILGLYKRKEIDWPEYERRFSRLISDRRIETKVSPEDIDNACLLCSEPKPAKCHRRLVAEHLQRAWGNVRIAHLE